MTDGKPPAAPPRAPTKTAVSGGLGLLAIIAAAVSVQAPRTAQHEGTVYRAYQDQGGVWTICDGHTAGVRAGVVATKAQCDTWLKQDLSSHMAAALKATPMLAEQPSALEQAGDFAFNAGDGRYAGSPMARQFAARQWRAGCEAFRGYITLYRAPRIMPGQFCRRKASTGVIYCEAKGLVARRETERAACLAGLQS